MNTLAGRHQAQDAILAAVAVAIAVLILVTHSGEDGNSTSAGSFVIVAVVGLTLLNRRQHPVPVLAVVLVARLVLTWESGNDLALAPAAMIALYTLARTGERRTNIAVAVGAAMIMTVGVAALDTEAFLPEALGEAALLLLPIALGDAARSRADQLRDLIDTEADRRVSAERLRIARDLHDVVAHGLSTIAIQSGVAAHLLDRDPNQAKQALEVINETGRSALEELRAMVGVLRSTDDAPLRPTPTDPNDLTELVTGAANSGIVVSVSASGQFPPDVSDSSVVAVHRIVQEALTNVARHAGPVRTQLSIEHGEHLVLVAVVNDAGTRPDTGVPSTGVGIIGMTERAEALGGTLKAHTLLSGGFEVAATIPYHQRSNQTGPP